MSSSCRSLKSARRLSCGGRGIDWMRTPCWRATGRYRPWPAACLRWACVHRGRGDQRSRLPLRLVQIVIPMLKRPPAAQPRHDSGTSPLTNQRWCRRWDVSSTRTSRIASTFPTELTKWSARMLMTLNVVRWRWLRLMLFHHRRISFTWRRRMEAQQMCPVWALVTSTLRPLLLPRRRQAMIRMKVGGHEVGSCVFGRARWAMKKSRLHRNGSRDCLALPRQTKPEADGPNGSGCLRRSKQHFTHSFTCHKLIRKKKYHSTDMISHISRRTQFIYTITREASDQLHCCHGIPLSLFHQISRVEM